MSSRLNKLSTKSGQDRGDIYSDLKITPAGLLAVEQLAEQPPEPTDKIGF
jgi:hypothetical protein